MSQSDASMQLYNLLRMYNCIIIRILYTVRGKILEWEKIGKFGETWALRKYFTHQLFLFRIFQLG